jgi:hypothetical protein
MEEYRQTRFAKQHTHKYFVDLDTNDAVCLCGKVKGSAPGRGVNKYSNESCIYNGVSYDSKFEAHYAQNLDWLLKAGAIKKWERQFPVRIRYRGETICTLWVDFLVHHTDGSLELAETKGFETDTFKLKKRLLEIMWLPDHKEYRYTLIK